MSTRFGITSLEEARAYLAHPVLASRLREAFEAVLGHEDAETVLGRLDAMKLRSSATLFHRAAPEDELFGRVLDGLFGGRPDEATDELLAMKRRAADPGHGSSQGHR